ncbi:MAG: hypothetical protein JXK07_12060 [Spirochaetes bacterium]|nr:hypothetical protein [Spirochaetota bacterium]MBN2769434.1 hypothetical protein [Spirochaetota bacterium]
MVTAQRILDTLEKYKFVISSKQKKGLGRPSKIYTYMGGEFSVNLDEMLKIYQSRLIYIREAGNPEVSFSFDIDKELINAVLLKGRSGKKIKMDDQRGRLLWLLPPPDSRGETIESIAEKTGFPIIDSVIFFREMIELNIIEEVK